MAKNLVLECGEECSFKSADGREIRNLNDLSESFENMDDNVFSHHVNDEKNDFSAWAKDALNDDKLASDLESAKDKKVAQVAVLKRIIELVQEVSK